MTGFVPLGLKSSPIRLSKSFSIARIFLDPVNPIFSKTIPKSASDIVRIRYKSTAEREKRIYRFHKSYLETDLSNNFPDVHSHPMYNIPTRRYQPRPTLRWYSHPSPPPKPL